MLNIYLIDNKEEDIVSIHEILTICGKDMYEHYGLSHWKTPYAKEKIREDFTNKRLFLVQENDVNIGTFSLQINHNQRTISISKFAVLPRFSGKGYGSQIVKWIEEYSRSLGIYRLQLDVYVRSSAAIAFYKKNDFLIVGSRKTKNFEVYEMIKNIKEEII